MVVATNRLAMNASRMFGITTLDLQKRSEKLASGYRINRATDDAAGLFVSEKMRRQIRGLTQTMKNIRDGVSLCQVADGALNETLDILQRMNELSVKAANGTNSLSDRKIIQQEIDQLTMEVDRIANTTSFNEYIFPLTFERPMGSNGNGNAASVNSLVFLTEDGAVIKKAAENRATDPAGNDPQIRVDEEGQAWWIPDQLKEGTRKYRVNSQYQPVMADGVPYSHKAQFSVTYVGFKDEGTQIDWHYAWSGDGKSEVFSSHLAVTDAGGSLGQYVFYSLKLEDIKVDTNGYLYYINKRSGDNVYLTVKKNDSGKWIGRGCENAITSLSDGWSYLQATRDGEPPSGQLGISSKNNNSDAPQIFIQAGAEAGYGDRVGINLVDATCKGIGIDGLSVIEDGKTEQSINRINSALSTVSRYRSYFGAIQNRLEYAYNINSNMAENTQYAESRIRDMDVAVEMVKYSSGNIFSQFGTAMLAQANQGNQFALQLLG